MNLEPFGWAIGPSDIIQYRTCPQRFAFGMRRHVKLPERFALYEGERDNPPEADNWTNAYGSAIHEAIAEVERGASHADAIKVALARYGTYLTPADVELLGEDLHVYELRKPQRDGVELVAAEKDMRVPLFVADDGRQVYFRFKLDVLHRLKANPGVFLSRDYKSSAHRRTHAEVHSDVQQWSYNFGIHELYPECHTLLQSYDQLKFGVVPTSKNAEQREQMRQWLIANVKVIMADEVLVPKQNDFCRWCPMVATCRETQRSTAYWRGRLAVIAPLSKEGRKIKVEFAEEGDELERIIRDELPQMQQTRKHIEHVEKTLKSVIEAMPVEERARLRWRLGDRKSKTITEEGLRELHGLLGDAFYALVSLPMGRLEELEGEDSEAVRVAKRATVEEVTSSTLIRAKS